ncbi:SMI1/KNR4 family protein [Pleionea sp. CnH1-48]|uniref:SMI1/KNR4 family protein n=1 Tax=Pleionea sp. CnH1-48 TaxID=2954494 RepID=UPI0020969C93|nr:SMI1/KNR4 family protein [Pleionea sp. CnH1-48]MCO7226696.1 SMI1/KNR4 family protein [Pleionea sp. CnH1-48]
MYENELKEIESIIGKALPIEFKTYVNKLEDDWLEPSYSFPLKEPTPFGSGVIESLFVPVAEYLAEDEFFELGMLCIGNNMFGCGVYLSMREEDFGAVYYWDHEQRCFWEDEVFYRMFPNLSEGIANYLELRKKRKVLQEGESLVSFYKAADSFVEFIDCWEPMDDESDEEISDDYKAVLELVQQNTLEGGKKVISQFGKNYLSDYQHNLCELAAIFNAVNCLDYFIEQGLETGNAFTFAENNNHTKILELLKTRGLCP